MAAKPRAGPAPARLEVAASTDSLASRQAPVLPSDPPGAAGDFDGFDVREPRRTRTDDPFRTIQGRGRHRSPQSPGSPMNAGHGGPDGISRTQRRAPETPQTAWGTAGRSVGSTGTSCGAPTPRRSPPRAR